MAMPFHKSEIDFSVTGSIPPLVADYLAGKNSLTPFFDFYPNLAGFKKAIEKRKSLPVNRETLVQVLRGQNQSAGEATLQNITLLLDEKTFSVTTGHQLNLFTGPLYFIYKILSVVKLTGWLKENFPDNHFVPVYWMASEDHDIEEISHTYIFGNRVGWEPAGKGAAGKLSCRGVEPAIEKVKSLLGENESAAEIIALLTRAYNGNHSLAQATRILVQHLFAKYGLVILDADDERLRKGFIPVMKQELLEKSSFQKSADTIASLQSQGYEVQVHPREINLFYLGDNYRERIVHEDGKFRVLNRQEQWDEKGLLAELENHPGRFSPNVVLRPVYQEFLLPDIAYVGGPAEIAYWLEYKKLFDHFKVFFPALVLRNSAMLIDGASAERMEKLRISGSDLFKTADELSADFIRHDQNAITFSEEAAAIAAAYDAMARKAGSLEATFARSVEGEKQKQLNTLKSLEEKITRLQKKKHEISIQQIRKLKDKLFPDESLQERHENFISFYHKYGDSFFDNLLEAFEPAANRFLLLKT